MLQMLRQFSVNSAIAAMENKAFSECCLQVLWTPTNNVDSKRVLSQYGAVVSGRQCNLKEENAELFTCYHLRKER